MVLRFYVVPVGKGASQLGFPYALILEGHVNQAAAVQTYASERQSTYTNKQSVH